MFHAVSPDDPLTAIQLTQADFSWKKPDPQSNSEVDDASPTQSLYLHNLNLSVKKVCATVERKAHDKPIKGKELLSDIILLQICSLLQLPSFKSYFLWKFQGSLFVVVGKVGCGKSSLLAGITGELNRYHLMVPFIFKSF